MTNLEFIEKEIEETQSSYKAFALDYKIFHRESDKRDAEKYFKKLIHLQQIKYDLEAWEICKKFITNLGGEYALTIDSYYNKIEYQTLKKALEVKEC